MYQMLYGTSLGINSTGSFTFSGATSGSMNDLGVKGKLTFSYLDGTGSRTALTSSCKGKFDVILGRPKENGGPVVLPLHMNECKVAGVEYNPGTTFAATVTCQAIDEVGDITLLITKKGVPFNERASWTVNEHVTKAMTNAQVAALIAKGVNANKNYHGLVATVSGNVITLNASEPTVDYTIQATDLLETATVAVTTPVKDCRGLDAKKVALLASKAAADAGFEYTYQDGAELIYPEYPFNPNGGVLTGSFDMLVINCAEPRDFKTHEETVHQQVTIVMPHATGTGTGFINSMYQALVAAGAEGKGFVPAGA